MHQIVHKSHFTFNIFFTNTIKWSYLINFGNKPSNKALFTLGRQWTKAKINYLWNKNYHYCPLLLTAIVVTYCLCLVQFHIKCSDRSLRQFPLNVQAVSAKIQVKIKLPKNTSSTVTFWEQIRRTYRYFCSQADPVRENWIWSYSYFN